MRRFALLAFLAAACGGDDDRPASWSYIHAAIIVPNCATSGCHSKLSKRAGIDFEERDSARDFFINNSALSVVKGIDPNAEQMPPDEPLSETDIQLIERWTVAGEPDN